MKLTPIYYQRLSVNLVSAVLASFLMIQMNPLASYCFKNGLARVRLITETYQVKLIVNKKSGSIKKSTFANALSSEIDFNTIAHLRAIGSCCSVFWQIRRAFFWT